jgi:hypothetical protein
VITGKQLATQLFDPATIGANGFDEGRAVHQSWRTIIMYTGAVKEIRKNSN